ncbi:MAG: hypothetical protein BV457_01590 [Thermoplasmata archaeon M9B1D]|nr:MAG: hypothetical protein BV457_01590 [Thermoplasmata archaeon M9B1D]
MFKKNLSIIFAIVILIIVSLSWIIPLTMASDTGYISPENYPLDYDEWSAPDNAFSQDDSYATSDYDSRQNEQTWYEFAGLEEVFDSLPGCPVINGIQVSFDAYGSGGGITYDIKLTWNLGTTYTSAQTSGVLPTVDSDTYLTVGGTSELWGRSWVKTDFYNDAFGVYIKQNGALHDWTKLDHLRVKVFYDYVQPGAPTNINVYNRVNHCNQSTIDFSKGTGADTTLIKYSTEGFPTLSTGTQMFNGSNNSYYIDYDVLGLYYNTEYYLSLWSWNNTYCCYSNSASWFFVTPCNHKINNIYNNTENTTGGYEYSYSLFYGYNIWLNFTGVVCGNTSLTKYQNIVDATGSHESIYNSITGWKVWANYTGTGSGCELQYFNYSDNNITLNLTYWGCNNTNTSNYSINNDNWLNIAGFNIDADQLTIFITLSLFFFFFSEGYRSKKRSGGAFMFFSGFIFLGFSLISTISLNALYIVPLMIPFSGFIMLIGIRKWFFKSDTEKTED